MVEKLFQEKKYKIRETMLVIMLFFCFIGCSQTLSYGNSVISKDNIEIEYIIAEFERSQNIYIDKVKRKKIKPENSALVIIDLWEKDFLNPMINNFINPIINDFNDLGFKIIYAPSQYPQNKNLLKVDNGITFYNLDTMDSFVEKNDIKNLFFLGFDTLYCVIDKPNGLYSYKQRNKDINMNYFVFDKGVTSFSKEMREVALSLFKKNGIGLIMTDNIAYDNIYPTKTNLNLLSKTSKTLDKGNNLVLIFKNKKENDSLNRFETKLKKTNINCFTVIEDKLFTNKGVLNSDDEFIDLLVKSNIKNIYYAGNHLNNEILWSKFGIINLYIHERYFKITKLPKVFVVNDLTFIANSINNDPLIEKAVIINHYRGISNILSKNLITKQQ